MSSFRLKSLERFEVAPYKNLHIVYRDVFVVNHVNDIDDLDIFIAQCFTSQSKLLTYQVDIKKNNKYYGVLSVTEGSVNFYSDCISFSFIKQNKTRFIKQIDRFLNKEYTSEKRAKSALKSKLTISDNTAGVFGELYQAI